MRIAPAPSNRSTITGDVSGTQFANAHEPRVATLRATGGVWSLPMRIAPAPSNRSTITGDVSGTQFANAHEPRVVTLPAIRVKSLIATGRPCSGLIGASSRTILSQ